MSSVVQPPLREVGRSNARFLSGPMIIGLGAYAAFALTFCSFQIRGDGSFYFDLLRGFFGEHTDNKPVAYQFGSDVWNVPFFLVGRGLGAVFGLEPHIFHVTFEEISITIGAQVAFLLTLLFAWKLLRELELPRGPGVLLLTAFGSPLFYAVVFDPAGKHAVDTLIVTWAVLLVARSTDAWTTRDALTLGVLAGVSLNVRYVNVALFVAFAFAVYRVATRRQFALAACTTVFVGLLVFVTPALRGIGYIKIPSFFRLAATGHREASGARPVLAVIHANPLRNFDITIPWKMLFSEHRGLFLWTPLTAFAVAGFVLAVMHGWRSRNRPFYTTLASAAVLLLLAHTIWNAWDGGFAFSQRFLTALYPLYVIGIAELVRRSRNLVESVALYCALIMTVQPEHDRRR